MIAVDSNILIRIALRDDVDQAMRAQRLLAEAVTQGQRIVVSTTAVVEAVWAMRKPYKIPKPAIMNFIKGLILNRAIDLLDRELIVKAADLYATLPVDFADCILSVDASRAGLVKTFSFDSDAIKSGLFSPVPY